MAARRFCMLTIGQPQTYAIRATALAYAGLMAMPSAGATTSAGVFGEGTCCAGANDATSARDAAAQIALLIMGFLGCCGLLGPDPWHAAGWSSRGGSLLSSHRRFKLPPSLGEVVGARG